MNCLRPEFPGSGKPLSPPLYMAKRENMAFGIEDVIISLYLKGLSNWDIEEQNREIYDFDVSTSTRLRITEKKLSGNKTACQNLPMEPVYLIVWLGGIMLKVYKRTTISSTRLSILLRASAGMVKKFTDHGSEKTNRRLYV